MGSFNVACSISNLTIHEGDKAGLMFIQRKPSYGPSAALTFRVYNTDDFLPYLPPVFGVYDDYGNLADLTPSPTVTVIEELFNRPALAIVNAIGQDRGIYDSCNPLCELYMPGELFKLLAAYDKKDEDVFQGFGFAEVPATDGYVQAWQFGDWRAQSRKYDGFEGLGRDIFRWDIDNAVTGKTLATNIIAANGVDVVISTLAKGVGIYPGYLEEDWARIERLQTMSGSFFLTEVYDKMKERVLADPYDGGWTEGTEEKLKEILATILVYRQGTELYKGTPLSEILTRTDYYRSIALKAEDEWWAMRHYLNNTEFRDALIYPVVLMATNRMLAPSYNGAQFGNDPDARFLNAVTDEILAARKARFGEDEDEDD